MRKSVLPFLPAALCAPVPAAVEFFDPVTQAPPATVKALGIYTDIEAKLVDPALKYFEVNAALWSDGSAKQRWVVLPAGTKIIYDDTTDAFDYPERAMFVKNFYLDEVTGDTATRKYWETRILVNKHDAQGMDTWHGFTYKWNADASNATLVSSLDGFDTVFFHRPRAGAPHTYKKWSFPSQSNCVRCHKQDSKNDGQGPYPARGVLGFFPAQLKRQAPRRPSINQVTWLFNEGVFLGDPPSAERLKARWKGLSEAIPAGPADLRFRVIDSMARSYIAANCSGCHSTRNVGLADAHSSLIYDWHTLTPRIEFGAMGAGTQGIDYDTTGDPLQFDHQDGRYKYLVSVQRAGMAENPFWTMGLPPKGLDPTIITRGYPSVSTLLYRQFGKRRPPWRDSLSMRRKLAESDPGNLKAWIFTEPWGTEAWRAGFASRGIRIDTLFGSAGLFVMEDDRPMPLLATHLPDTAAMRVLGEWATNYVTLVPVEGFPIISRVNGRGVATPAEAPRLIGRTLAVPAGWTGEARMFSLTGRAWALPSAGRGRYVVPGSAPAGVYLFRVGGRAFRATITR